MKSGYVYAVAEKSKAKKGETEVYRSTLIDPQEPLVEWFVEGVDTIKKSFINTVDSFGDDYFLGTREQIVKEDGTADYGKYKFKTYHQIYEDVMNLAKSFTSHKLYSETVNERKKHRLIGIYAKNCESWVVTDFACCMAGIGTVTLYDTFGDAAIEYIINQAELSTIVCTANHADSLLKSKADGKIEPLANIVAIDQLSAEQAAKCEQVGLTLLTIDQLIQEGAHLETQLNDPEPDDIFTICYTSGTTGNPKGVMISHQNMIAGLAPQSHSSIKLYNSDVHLSYLPLAHIMERIIVHCLTINGSRIGFYQGDVLKLKEDLAELRPTIFVSVPRLYSRFYDVMQSKLAELKGCKKKLADKAIKAKLENLNKSGKVKHCLYDKLIFKKFRAVLGGRVRIWVTASAPISKDILDFLKIAFCCPVIEAYGQTELTGAWNATIDGDTTNGHVGGVLPSFLMKLQDVPEMNYLSTDVIDGVPHPRGEVCFKGAACFVGYFKELDKTKETIDNDGWLHTGDVGMILPNGALKIIDRKKNIFKLSQGEYIAPEKLEILYAKNPLIKQIFVYGDSLQASLVAIVVPEKEEVEKEFGHQSDYNSFICSKEFQGKLMEWFNTVRKKEKLNGLEVPKSIHCTSREFSIDDGTLTPTFKLVRGQARNLYIDEIRQMYGGAKLQGE